MSNRRESGLKPLERTLGSVHGAYLWAPRRCHSTPHCAWAPPTSATTSIFPLPTAMASPFAQYPAPATPTAPRGSAPAARGTGAKRGRKPKNANANASADTSRTASTSQQQPSQASGLQWVDSQLGAGTSQPPSNVSAGSGTTPGPTQDTQAFAHGLSLPGMHPPSSTPAVVGESGTPGPSGSGTAATPGANGASGAVEEDGDGEDEVLPAMADDDYSAQLSWQTQSKDNLKYV